MYIYNNFSYFFGCSFILIASLFDNDFMFSVVNRNIFESFL